MTESRAGCGDSDWTGTGSNRFRYDPAGAPVLPSFLPTGSISGELPKPDFVFIDAYHSYEACLRDTKNILSWVGDEAMVDWYDVCWKKFIFLENNYGVHSSIVDGTSPEAIPYTFRIKDTTLMVRSKAHEALFRRDLVSRG
jgi:hypothetical protein